MGKSVMSPINLVLSLVVLVMLAILGYFVLVENSISKPSSLNDSLRSEFRVPAKVALNALGEIKSIQATNPNSDQFTAVIQSSKIKFDSAVRDLTPQNMGEVKIKSDLESVMSTYLDAKTVWEIFIQAGDEHGFMTEKYFKHMSRWEIKYGLKPIDLGEGKGKVYYRGTAVTSILEKAAKGFEEVSRRIN